MKILIADKFPARWKTILTERGHQITDNPALDETTLPQAVREQEILIVRSTKVPAAVLDAADKLRLVIRAGAGYDTIDVKRAAEKGIAVCNCPGTNSVAVAELAMGLLLALDRRIYHNTRDLKNGVWNKSEYGKAKGLFGRTLGIVGLGNIGKEVAKRAQAFGMDVVAYDSYGKPEAFAAAGIQRETDLYALASRCDAVTVHLPDTPQTHGLFDKKFFDAMKPDAIFINTARGGLVRTDDLIAAMKEKNLRAALDVYENEPKAGDKTFAMDELAAQENFYGTHHIGASTEQAQDAVAEMAVAIIDEFAAAGIFLNKVN